MKQQNKNRKLKITTLITLVLVILGLALLLNWESIMGPGTASVPEQTEPQEKEISILCVGDIMSHMPQTNAQYDSESGTYDYSENYEYVEHYIKAADLALCNVETTFAGKPYSGYPAFSSPDALATDLKEAGFDIGITANNHMADRGYDGVIRTQEVLKEAGLKTVGSVMNTEDPRYIIKDVNGIKIGVVAYTYETGSGSGTVSINGAYISDETASVINSFNFNTLDEDCAKMEADIQAAKAAGAQIIIAYYHWGEEYQRDANSYQEDLAKRAADMGADMIFASHPHVVQKAEYITYSESGRKVPVFYSMGNYISNQRTQYIGNRYVEQGLMATVDIKYLEGTGITSVKMGGIPTWVDLYYSGGTEYRIIPLDETMEENESLKTSGHLSSAKQALEDLNEILGRDSE